MKIRQVLAVKGLTGFFSDDKKAILHDAQPDGFLYKGSPMTEGFKRIREPGESVSVILLLEDGQFAYGDCCEAQYPAGGGRFPRFRAEDHIPMIEKGIRPLLAGKNLDEFRPLSEEIERFVVDGTPLHTAVKYGVTQALLDAVAKARKLTMAEVVAQEYGTLVSREPIRIKAQTGDDRYVNVDKMILKRVHVMPHGLINNVKQKLGEKGEIFLDYVNWVKNRVLTIGDEDYKPIFHFDVYGTIGLAFKNDLNKIANYITKVEEAARPFSLDLEMPMDLGGQQAQLEGMKQLKSLLSTKGSKVNLAVDEWCNTFEDIKLWVGNKAADRITVKAVDMGCIHNIIEAILYCNEHGVGAYLAQTCNQTDRATQVCANIALATRPFTIGAGPGMGMDEGLMIVWNEMQRVIAICNSR